MFCFTRLFLGTYIILLFNVMNILILSWRDPSHPFSGGAEISTLEHAKTWVKKGHKVVWFSSSFKDSKSDEIIEGGLCQKG